VMALYINGEIIKPNQKIYSQMCNWIQNRDVNPFTARRIKIGGDTYNQIEEYCKRKSTKLFEYNDSQMNVYNNKIDSIRDKYIKLKALNKTADVTLSERDELRIKEYYLELIEICESRINLVRFEIDKNCNNTETLMVKYCNRWHPILEQLEEALEPYRNAFQTGIYVNPTDLKSGKKRPLQTGDYFELTSLLNKSFKQSCSQTMALIKQDLEKADEERKTTYIPLPSKSKKQKKNK
jgi:hypothetical protein